MLLPRIRALPLGSQPCLTSIETALSNLRLSQASNAVFKPTSAIRYSASKAQGRANKAKDGPGKRLGAKKSGEQYVIPGNIIFRQRGTHWFPGDNCAMGRDHTIYATHPGYVKYYRDPVKHPKRQYIGVVFERTQTLPQPLNAVRRRRLGMLAYQMDESASETSVSNGGFGTAQESAATGGNAGVPSAAPRTAGKSAVVPKREIAKLVPTLRPGYQYRSANWEIGRAAERARIEVKAFKPGDRFAAWRKTNARKAKNAERRSMKRGGAKRAA